MNYKDKLKRLIQERRDLIDKKHVSNVFKETGDAKNFESQIRIVDDRLSYFKDKIVDASTFNIKTMSKTFTDLIRIYDGKNFVLRKINYVDDTKTCVFSSGSVTLLINKYRISDDARLSHINIMQKEGNAIPLCWNNETNKFKLYYRNDTDLANMVKLNRFPYLKDFANFVISYKIKKGIINLNKVELEKLKLKFLYHHKDDIKNYHEIKKQQEKIEHDKKLEEAYECMGKLLIKALENYNKIK